MDIPFPMNLRNLLLTEDLVSKHHWLPDSGWVTFRVRSEDDIPRALWLLKLSYLRYVLKQRSRAKVEADKNADSTPRALTELNLNDALKSAFEKIIGPCQKEGMVER
jgi:luciferase-like monooxygenase